MFKAGVAWTSRERLTCGPQNTMLMSPHTRSLVVAYIHLTPTLRIHYVDHEFPLEVRMTERHSTSMASGRCSISYRRASTLMATLRALHPLAYGPLTSERSFSTAKTQPTSKNPSALLLPSRRLG